MSTAQPFESTDFPHDSAYVVPAAPTAAPSNGMGTTGLVLGIVGGALMWVPFLGGVLGILATVFGGIGLANARSGKATNKGAAIAGLVLGIVTIVFWPVMIGIAGAAATVPVVAP